MTILTFTAGVVCGYLFKDPIARCATAIKEKSLDLWEKVRGFPIDR